jgi:hypothetical protein
MRTMRSARGSCRRRGPTIPEDTSGMVPPYDATRGRSV